MLKPLEERSLEKVIPMASKPHRLLINVTYYKRKIIFILEKSNRHQSNDQTASSVVVGLLLDIICLWFEAQQKVYRFNNVLLLLAKIV